MPAPAPPRILRIEDAADIAAIEAALAALAGAAAAAGGAAALAGRDVFAMSTDARAALLTQMYDAGEVVAGWRDGDGRTWNTLIARLATPHGAVVWRAEVFLETEDGHVSRGALAHREACGLARRLAAAAFAGFPEPLPGSAAAIRAAFAADGRRSP